MNRKTVRKNIKETNRKNKKLVRLAVFRSNTAIYATLIDDNSNKTIASFGSAKAAKGENTKAAASLVGAEIAKVAKKHNIDTVVFDRNGYNYHGKVKALAEAARKEGLKF